MLSNKRKESKLNKKLIYEKPTNLNNFQQQAEIKENKNKLIERENNRVRTIIKKFNDYKLNFTKEELQQTINRIGINFLTIEGAEFHLKFLKVMEYEQNNYSSKSISNNNHDKI